MYTERRQLSDSLACNGGCAHCTRIAVCPDANTDAAMELQVAHGNTQHNTPQRARLPTSVKVEHIMHMHIWQTHIYRSKP
eukprot:14685042-Alexandrium_andersonii.AAC.1